MTKPSFDLSPEQIRQLGYMAADAVAEQRAGLTSRPVFGKVGAGAAAFDEPPPEEGQPIAGSQGNSPSGDFPGRHGFANAAVSGQAECNGCLE